MSVAVLHDKNNVVIPSVDGLSWRTQHTPEANRARKKVVSEISDTKRRHLLAILTAPKPVVRSRHRRLMKRSRNHESGSGPYWFTRPGRKRSFAAVIILGTATVNDFTDLLVRGDVTRCQLALFLLRTKKLGFEVVSRIERALNEHTRLKQDQTPPAQTLDPAVEKLAAFWRAIQDDALWCSTTVVEPIVAAIQDGTFAKLWRDGQIDHTLIEKLRKAGFVDNKYLATLNLSMCPEVTVVESGVPPLEDLFGQNGLDTTGELNLLLLRAALTASPVS